jgi:hypothetical protein
MEPYDVIVNQPVVIDNVSEFALLIGDFAKEDLDNRMNHHRPGENFFHLTLSSVCVFAGFRHRESWFRWRPSAQMHFPQLVSGRSASNRRKILDDITRKSFSFCFNCSLTLSSIIIAVWADRNTFGLWLERWRAIFLWDQRPKTTGDC